MNTIEQVLIRPSEHTVSVHRHHEVTIKGGKHQYTHEEKYYTIINSAELHSGVVTVRGYMPAGTTLRVTTDLGEFSHTSPDAVTSHNLAVSLAAAINLADETEEQEAMSAEETFIEINETELRVTGATVSAVVLEDHTHEPVPSDVLALLTS